MRDTKIPKFALGRSLPSLNMDTTHLDRTETIGCQKMKGLLGKEGLVKVAFEPYC